MTVLRRLARCAQWILPGAGWTWFLLVLVAGFAAGAHGSVGGAVLAAGAIGCWTLVALAVAALILAVVPARLVERHAQSRTALERSVAVRPLIASAVVVIVARAAAPFALERVMPAIDLRAVFIEAGAWGIAGVAAVAATLLVGRRSWKLALAMTAGWLVVVRLLAARPLAVAFMNRESWIELGSIGFLLLALSPLAHELRGRVRWLDRVALGMAAAWLISVAVLVGTIDRRPLARADLVLAFPGPASLLKVARRVLDFDGDGYAAVLGGQDCDDADPDVSPAALEIVANGRDDNCQGGDLRDWSPGVDGPVDAAAPHRSLVLVTIDALRADMLREGQMDSVWAFARGGARFANAYTVAGLTDYSLRSLMTGRYPMDFTNGERFFGQEPSLAEILSAAGYGTVAVHSIWAINPYTLQGFAEVDDSLSPRHRDFGGTSAKEVTDRALVHYASLRASGRPFFLWVHYFDVHSDYMRRPEAPPFGNDTAGRYRQEVWATDRELGRLLATIERSGFLGENLIAVTADHGEMLGEHGHIGHAYWHFEPVLRVPLVLRGGGIPAGVFGARVRSIDLFPTLVRHTLGARPATDGLDLRPILDRSETGDRDVFMFSQYLGSDARAVLAGPWKLMQDVKVGLDQLVRLDADPGEDGNRIEDEPAVAARLRQAIGRRWDESVNDRMMKRKIDRYGARRMSGELRDRYELRKYEYYCSQGYKEDCQQAARMRARSVNGAPAPAGAPKP